MCMIMCHEWNMINLKKIKAFIDKSLKFGITKSSAERLKTVKKNEPTAQRGNYWREKRFLMHIISGIFTREAPYILQIAILGCWFKERNNNCFRFLGDFFLGKKPSSVNNADNAATRTIIFQQCVISTPLKVLLCWFSMCALKAVFKRNILKGGKRLST